jgi:hypothetical protein
MHVRQPPAHMQTSARPFINTIHITTIDVSKIISTSIQTITIRNMDITMRTILSMECARAHLIKLK